MRSLDTNEYVSVLRELVGEGHEVSVPISGSSMQPFLVGGRDAAYFRAPWRELAVGDIVFFRRSGGEYILHRICAVNEGGFLCVGDAQLNPEQISRDQVFGLVTKVRRKGKSLEPGDLVWEFFAGFWLRNLPRRERLLKIASILNI